MTITAKPVIKDQFWILRSADGKVGNIEATTDGYQVKIQDRIQKFKTISMVKQKIGIHFELATPGARTNERQVHGYPTTGRAHNPIYEVKTGLPLFTKTAKSKSWYAAGWYRVYQSRRWSVVHCPKLITLRRYQYHGPFRSAEEAQ
jgi:hypothetical protein